MKKSANLKVKTELIKMAPVGIIKFFARPYVAGYSVQSAVDCAEKLLKDNNVETTVDVLGESANSLEAAVRFKDLYLRTIRMIADRFSDRTTIPTVSLKPSSVVYAQEKGKALEIDRNSCESHIEEIARMARSCGIGVTIDMEGTDWTDVTLAIYKSLREKGLDNVGTVLQSMLFRTDDDIKDLPENPRIRICTGGVYSEPPNVAHQTKEKMKEQLIEHTKQLFEKGAYVEIATHDEELIEEIFRSYIIPKDIPSKRFEIQLLKGVPRDKLISELLNGNYLNYGKKVKVRLYLPFAEDEVDAIKYCKRRLVANPEIMKYGLMSFFSSS